MFKCFVFNVVYSFFSVLYAQEAFQLQGGLMSYDSVSYAYGKVDEIKDSFHLPYKFNIDYKSHLYYLDSIYEGKLKGSFILGNQNFKLILFKYRYHLTRYKVPETTNTDTLKEEDFYEKFYEAVLYNAWVVHVDSLCPFQYISDTSVFRVDSLRIYGQDIQESRYNDLDTEDLLEELSDDGSSFAYKKSYVVTKFIVEDEIEYVAFAISSKRPKPYVELEYSRLPRKAYDKLFSIERSSKLLNCSVDNSLRSIKKEI